MERDVAKKELEKIMAQSNGEICIGMVHHFYGLLKGTIFRLKTEDLNGLLDFIENTMGIREISKDTTDETQKFILDIYERITLITNCQIVSNLESKDKYNLVHTIDEFKYEVINEIEAHKSDPYYHRTGEY
jgi:hypothetical protein